jgi:8-oxo-dGTP diphosphatase
MIAMKIGIDYVGISTPFYCHDGQGNLLLHKRSANCRDEHHRWDPGLGKLEPRLSLEQNVLQEVLEEYGCRGEIQGKLPAHDIFREHEGVKTHWIAVPFFIRVNRDEVKNNEPEKIEDLGWFTLDQLPEPLHTGFAHTLKTYRGEFDAYVRPEISIRTDDIK